jgi:hypothetical protein
MNECANLLAQRVYGESVTEESLDYNATALKVFHGPTPDRELVAASSGSVALTGNNTEAMKACIDSIGGRSQTLADDETLKRRRSAVDSNASVFGFVTEAGVRKLAEIGPAIIASRSPARADRVSAFSDLLQNVSKATIIGLLYAAELTPQGVTERYLAVLRPHVAESLMPAFSVGAPEMNSLSLVPRDSREATLIRVQRVGELPERALKQIAPNLDVVAGVALREFVISLRKQYGLESAESAGEAVGDELTLAEVGTEQPRVMIIRVRDRDKAAALAEKYLNVGGGAIAGETYNQVEIRFSSSDARRAASFVGEYLVLGTQDQIKASIDAQASGAGLTTDERFRDAFANRPGNAAILTYRPESESAARLLLAISKLTRVTDGSPRLLESDGMRKAIGRLPATLSTTEFREYGVYSQTKSSVGSFGLLASLFETREGEN